MKCPHSVPLKGKFNLMGEPVYRPCGMCAICRRNVMMDIVNRGKSEFRRHKYCAFLTLTYDDLHLYYQHKILGFNIGLPSVCKKHIQKFTDNLRHYIKYHTPQNCDEDFSFIYSTEYGGQFNRPHCHIALFGDIFCNIFNTTTCYRL